MKGTPLPSRELNLFEHLDELRARAMRCMLVFGIGVAICYFFSEQIMAFLRKPLFDVLKPEARKLYFTSLFENFLVHLKIAGYSSLFFLSPYFFNELWAFVAPGLYPHERRWAIPFVLATAVFFLIGALFAYYVLFPVGYRYFAYYGGPSDIPMFTIDSYYTMCIRFLLLFGLAFEFPVLVCLLGFLKIVNSTQLRKQRRYVIIFIAVISALFAPPDAVSMLLLATPLTLLYEGAILVVSWSERTRCDVSENQTSPQ